MNKIILSIIVIFLLPISVFGFDWTVSYDMKKSDGSIEYLELSVPKIKGFMNWKFPHQVKSWKCYLSKFNDKYDRSQMNLHCHSKEDGSILLTSTIECNRGDTKKNKLSVVYPKTIKNDESIPIQRTIVTLECEL